MQKKQVLGKLNKKLFLFFSLTLLNLNLVAQENYLDQVPKLQEIARQSGGGSMGCGVGSVILVTSNGELKIATNLDPIHVFGHKIIISDLIKLLEARIKSNKGLEKNQMTSDVSSLGYVILSTLSKSKDIKTIPTIVELLQDKDEVIRGWAGIALFKLGDSNEKIRDLVSKTEFPQEAIQSVTSKGVKVPNWIKIK